MWIIIGILMYLTGLSIVASHILKDNIKSIMEDNLGAMVTSLSKWGLAIIIFFFILFWWAICILLIYTNHGNYEEDKKTSKVSEEDLEKDMWEQELRNFH